jgi:hypothetical protein
MQHTMIQLFEELEIIRRIKGDSCCDSALCFDD